MNLSISSRKFTKHAIETFKDHVPKSAFGFVCVGSLIEVIGAEIEKIYRQNTMSEYPAIRPAIEEMMSDGKKMSEFLDSLVHEFSDMEYELLNGSQFHVIIRGVVRDVLSKAE